ncbi:HAD family hydrolase [Stackebrandtia soli]|uniref:HAD family hydrolase n=1 Tax=Stackebrandtia soli TaxID=1892856 RepID=UPI0039E88845
MDLSGIDVICFDGDDTLWDFETSMWGALAAVTEHLEAAGITRRGSPVTPRWLHSLWTEAASRSRGAPMASIRRESFAAMRDVCAPDRDDLVDELWGVYRASRLAELRLYPDAADALTRLRADFRLALVSNGNTYPDQLGIEDAFEVVVMAQDCGLRKPDPAIYHHVRGLFGVPSGRILHVGDHPVEDVTAAANAGFAVAWLNRRGTEWPLPDPAPRALRGLDELRGPR